MTNRPLTFLLLLALLTGCASSGSREGQVHRSSGSSRERLAGASAGTSAAADASSVDTVAAAQGLDESLDESESASFSLTAYQQDTIEGSAPAAGATEDLTVLDAALNADEAVIEPGLPIDQSPIVFEDVINSVHLSYPLVQAVYLERALTAGNQLSAWGAFDTKLKASSENQPLGFYETYRNSAGFETPIFGGGEFFGGYRNGGGDFEPWYQERETNDGGEFKGGLRVPLIRDKEIDSRRAELWRATYDQQIADPVIRANLVEFSREAGLSYWKWVANGQKYRLGQEWLRLATERNDGIQKRVLAGDLDPPEQIDNERAIAKRDAKLADSLRELQQSAAKLSLFLRDESGVPYFIPEEQTSDFPPMLNVAIETLNSDILIAQQNRPELQVLDLQIRQLRVDYAEALNMTRPGLDAQLVGSQDVGEPTSKKRDKSEFEMEAALFFDVPLQRRKGLGKMQAVQAKISQVTAKRRMVQDKVAAEVQAAYAGLIQSREEALRAETAVRLANQMADIERTLFDEGASDLLKVALREQYALEAAEELISARYGHFAAFTEYAAALANDRPTVNGF